MDVKITCAVCKQQVDEPCENQFRCANYDKHVLYAQKPRGPYEDKGGRLEAPTEGHATIREPTDADLLEYGYAPGNYTMRCTQCGKLKPDPASLDTRGYDKRARCCKECATERYYKAVAEQYSKPPLIVSTAATDIPQVDLKPGSVVYTGKPRIPVTDEMLSAGVAELGKHTYNHSHAEICEAVFKAMLDKVNDDGKRHCEHCGYRVRVPCTSHAQRLNCHNY